MTARRSARLLRRRFRLRLAGTERRLEIGAGCARQLIAELIAEHPAAHFFDRAGLQVTELEWTVGDADEAVHAKPKMLQHALHFGELDRGGDTLSLALSQGRGHVVLRKLWIRLLVHVQAMVSVARSDLSFT